MAKKSKITEPKKKVLTPELVNSLEGVLNNLQCFTENCINKQTAIYTISSFIRVFAYQKARFDVMRENIAEIIDSGTSQELSSAIKQMEYNEDIKAFDYVWSDASNLLDNLITDYCEDSTATPYSKFQTADEIYKDCRTQVLNPKSRNDEEKRDYLRAMLAL